MNKEENKTRYYFDLAFELAYWIHVNKEVAFFVAEDALDELSLMVENQEKNRAPSEQLRGFWKGGERARPLRQTIRINEPQMLQWLVYKQSQSWELKTERDEGLYRPTEEDMIVRYIEHLVFSTLKRGSFYVTLAVGPLLHQFDRRETRLLYDVLTQSDSARMKDMSYIGKQRLELLEKICLRFDQIQTVKKPGDEKQFVSRPSSETDIILVKECLRRFTPWETVCVIEPGFDITYISELYFSGTPSSDEDLVEINRIHTLLHPECFTRFADGLDKYVRMLPVDNQDKKCTYDSPDERITVPQFSHFPGGSSRGDRSQCPELTELDYVRFQRTLDARTRRRKDFTPQRLVVYVDNTLYESLDARRTSSSQFTIGLEADVIEVRGELDGEELTLATVLVHFSEIAAGKVFRSSIVIKGSQKAEIELTPIRDANGNVQGAQVEVSYTAAQFRQAVPLSAQRVWRRLIERATRNISESPRLVYGGLFALVALVALIMAIVWLQRGPARSTPPVEQAGPPQIQEEKPISPVTPPTAPEQPSTPNTASGLIASAAWSTDPQSALGAILVESTRDEVKTVDLLRQTTMFLNLPSYGDGGRMYSRYRIVLATGEKLVWQQTLRAPGVSLTGNAHILKFVVFPGRLPRSDRYDLRLEGLTPGRWQPLGHVLLKSSER